MSYTLSILSRGESLGSVVDVLCYRDYTREGKRVNTHSLIIQGVNLPTKSDSEGELTSVYLLCPVHVYSGI